MKILRRRYNYSRQKMRIYGILLLALLASNQAEAQWTRTRNNFFVGFEAARSIRSFSITSDQQNLAGSHVVTGSRYGVMFGNRYIIGKVRFGNLNEGQQNAPVISSGYEVASNFQILQFISKKRRLFEPYATLSIEKTTIRTSGNYVPAPAPEKETKPAEKCPCQCPPGDPPVPDQADAAIPADPDQVQVTEPVAYSGNMKTTRGNIGIGLRMHMEKGHVFFDLFAEAKYGIPLAEASSTQVLANTSASGQQGLDVGVSMGFVRNKSTAKKRKRLKFR